MDALYNFLFSCGSGLCHQLPERSIIFGGLQMPVCARCTGIYLGFLFTFIFFAIFYRHRPRARMGRALIVYALIFALPLALDGVSSYLTVRSTSNLLRVISGSACGAALAPLVYYLISDALFKTGAEQLVFFQGIRPWLLGLLGLALALVAVPLLGAASPWALLIVLVISIVATFWAVALAFVAVLPRMYRSVDSLKSAVVPLALSCVVGAALFVGTWYLQTWIHTLAGR